MNLAKRIVAAVLILLVFNLYLPTLSFAGQGPAKSPIKIRSTPEEDIPEVKEKKTSTWTWVLLLALLGGVAAAAGGGGGGGGGGETTPASDTGNYTIGW
jgi:hypothetical protein